MHVTESAADGYQCVEAIINGYGGTTDSLISMLQDIQSEYRYLPEDALRQVARSLGLSQIQVYGVATFFKAFSLTPRGKHIISVCLGTACHVRGAPAVLEEIERQLDIERGETTDDRLFTLETVNCVGACALGPAVIVDDEYHGQMNPAKVKRMLAKYRKAPGSQKHEKADISR